VRAAMTASTPDDEPSPASRLVDQVVGPAVTRASDAFLSELDRITVEDLCRDAEGKLVFGGAPAGIDFAI
jgi:Rrf2 family iron-sulfur cluster assembly transcriptional regulator